jgi:hypothetical protein
MTENLTPRKRRALAALLTEPTVKKAAVRAGVSRETLYKYLAVPEFQSALADAQSSVMQGVKARLAGLLGKSLDVLAGDLESSDVRHRQRAAALILGHYAGLAEFIDLAARVAALEQNTQGVNNGKS